MFDKMIVNVIIGFKCLLDVGVVVYMNVVMRKMFEMLIYVLICIVL